MSCLDQISKTVVGVAAMKPRTEEQTIGTERKKESKNNIQTNGNGDDSEQNAPKIYPIGANKLQQWQRKGKRKLEDSNFLLRDPF